MFRFGATVDGGSESEIAAMVVDLRESTKLASGRLPFDALFLFDRYIQAVTIPVNNNFGHVTSIAGDGVMSVFGSTSTSTVSPARKALTAALAIWEELERLNAESSSELSAPLRIGIGIHVEVSIVGWVADRKSPFLQFLGDTGNIAAKLEEQTKLFQCTLVVSTVALSAAGLSNDDVHVAKVSIAGKSEPLDVATFGNKQELVALLAGSINPLWSHRTC